MGIKDRVSIITGQVQSNTSDLHFVQEPLRIKTQIFHICSGFIVQKSSKITGCNIIHHDVSLQRQRYRHAVRARYLNSNTVTM
jgi:hypothetical protein